MSRRLTEQVTQTLQSLLTGYHASGLPQQLIELATTLLLQSQAKASSLKPEEEPGRCFAVCEIACQRLKTILNLPKIESRPPCAPRTYKKLYQFLNRILEAPEPDRSEATPARSNIGRIVTLSKLQEPPAGATPGSASRRTGKSLLTSSGANAGVVQDSEAGTPSEKCKRNDAQQQDVQQTSKRLAPEEETPEPDFVDAAENLDEVASASDGEIAGDEHDLAASGPPPKSGLGSLMENQFDWLSPERRLEYKRWEAKMLRKIDAMERQQGLVPAVS